MFYGKADVGNLLKGKDVNNFCSSYSENKEWDSPDLVSSEEFYNIAKRVFEADGREILDATLDGDCNVFEKVDYKHLFINRNSEAGSK